MKKLLWASVILFIFSVLISWNKRKDYRMLETIRPWVLEELTLTKKYLEQGVLVINDKDKLRKAYLESRKHYKHIEFFIEYCSPDDVKYMINGTLVKKNDHEMGSLIIEPMGFQVIEELLYSESERLDTLELSRQFLQLRYKFDNLHSYYKDITLSDGTLLEMCQLELYRIAALNLNGFDATYLKNNIQETVWALAGIEKVIRSAKPLIKNNKSSFKKLEEQLSLAKNFLASNLDFDSFDRLSFITEQLNPLNESIVVLHNHLSLPWIKRKQALNLNNKFLFTGETFNANFFSADYNDTLNLNIQAKLGKLLFFDPLLSGDSTRSCAVCHNPSKAFADGLPTSKTMSASDVKLRNAPSLIDIGFQKAFFWDGRVYELEQQVFDVIHNRNEMGGNLEMIADRLKNIQEYRSLFDEAYKGTRDTIITGYAIQKALTEYEKTLVSFNSRFDTYLKGNKKALTEKEVNGYNLFAGKALCGSCHFFPLFNGTVPPDFKDSEFEILGIPSSAENRSADSDLGRYKITGLEIHKYSFKTPGIRNIELTAPYMHNGVFQNLEQVLDFYHKGGGKGIGYFESEQTLPEDSLKLSEEEKTDIILFLKTLTDTSGVTSIPSVLPALNKQSPQRRLGKSY